MRAAKWTVQLPRHSVMTEDDSS